MEVWKAIEGYEGTYEVSSHGHIRSTTRTRMVKNRYGGHNERTDVGQEITPVDNGNGYLYVTLRKNGKRKNFYVHRLVAAAFCENEGRGDVINHKDLNKKNNHADNLEWCTQRENVLFSANSMRKPKGTCRETNTGEKYIRLYQQKGRSPVYRVSIRRLNICKQFKTLPEAVEYREEVMRRGE